MEDVDCIKKVIQIINDTFIFRFCWENLNCGRLKCLYKKIPCYVWIGKMSLLNTQNMLKGQLLLLNIFKWDDFNVAQFGQRLAAMDV